MTWNEALQDELIESQTDLLRLAQSTADDLIAILDRTDAQIKALLLDLESSGAVTATQYADIRAAQERIAQLRAEVWGQLSIELQQRAQDIAVASQQGIMAAVLTASAGEIVPAVATSQSIIAIAASRPFEGRILSEWAESMQSADIARYRRAIQLGMVAGRNPRDIAREIHGVGGVRDQARRNIEAVVRTATNHIAAETQALFVAQNEWIKKERYTATLDSRTTLICASLDGQVFDANEGPRPPLHFNCRSRRIFAIDEKFLANGARPYSEATDAGAMRAYRDAGGKGSFTAFRRAYFRSRVGDVPASRTYADWIKSRSAAVQDDILGPTRGKLLREGGLKIDQFTTNGGRTLTLAELQAKHAAAFKRAGINQPSTE